MKKVLKKIDYSAMVTNAGTEGRRIGNDLILFDDYELDPVYEYEFISAGNTAIEIIEGAGNIVVDGICHEVKAPCLIMYLRGQKIRTNIQEDTIQRSLVCSDHFMEELFLSAMKFNDIRSSLIDNPVIPIPKDSLYKFEMFVQVLKDIADFPDIGNNVICAKHLMLVLIYGPLYEVFRKKSEDTSFRAPKVSNDFFQLLGHHFREEHNMGFYSLKLNISERYLYTTVLSVTGKTPSFWVDNYLISEAKRLLDDRDMSIMQISQLLHFSSLPSFTRFFKRKEGVSPSEYRHFLNDGTTK